MLEIKSNVVIRRDRSVVYKNLKDPSFLSRVLSICKSELSCEESGLKGDVLDWSINIDGAKLSWREKRLYDDSKQEIHFRMVNGDFRLYEGFWKVESTKDNNCSLSFCVSIDWGSPFFIQFIGPIIDDKAIKFNKAMMLVIKRLLDNKITIDRFGFIFHPLDINLFAAGFNEPDILKMPEQVMHKAMEWFPPFRRASVTGIYSREGIEIEGDMILCTLLPQHILDHSKRDFAIRRTIEAGKVAESLSDKIVGLGAYLAHIGKYGRDVASNLNIPVTSGTTYTIAVAIKSIEIAAQKIGVDLRNSKIVVIGASGNIGKVISRHFAKSCSSLTLVSRHLANVADLAKELNKSNHELSISLETNINKAVMDKDVVIFATNTPSIIVNEEFFMPGSIVCDVSRPRNVSLEAKNKRRDVLVIDGGVVRLPGNPDFHFSFGLNRGLAFACMAETMILTLEKRFESYSLSGKISLDKVHEIDMLAQKHGFVAEELRSFDQKVNEADIKIVADSRKNRLKKLPGRKGSVVLKQTQ